MHFKTCENYNTVIREVVNSNASTLDRSIGELNAIIDLLSTRVVNLEKSIDPILKFPIPETSNKIGETINDYYAATYSIYEIPSDTTLLTQLNAIQLRLINIDHSINNIQERIVS